MNEERNTNGQRRRFTSQEKVAVLREHFIEKIPISQICDKHGLSPALFYRWQQEFFEKGSRVFEPQERISPALEHRVKALTAKLVRKDEVIAELMEDHINLKKSLGEI